MISIMDPMPRFNKNRFTADSFASLFYSSLSPQHTHQFISKQTADVKRVILCFMLLRELSKRNTWFYNIPIRLVTTVSAGERQNRG